MYHFSHDDRSRSYPVVPLIRGFTQYVFSEFSLNATGIMKTKSGASRVLCAALVVLSACHDLPTAVVTAPRDPSHATTSAGQHLGEVPFYCVQGKRAAEGRWQTRLDTLFFPRAELAGGRTVSYQYRLSTSDGKLLSAADCVVPYTEAALRRLDRFFRVQKGGGAEQYQERQGMITTQDCVTNEETGCFIDPLVVVAPPPEIPPCDACNYYPGGNTDGGGDGGGGTSGGSGGSGSAYEQGPLLWGACILAMVGSNYSIWQVADKFDAWYRAYQNAQGTQRLWRATVENNASPFIQQLYEYQYKQAYQRQQDAAGAVSEATNTSYFALAGAAIACGATVLIPTP